MCHHRDNPSFAVGADESNGKNGCCCFGADLYYLFAISLGSLDWLIFDIPASRTEYRTLL